MSVSSSTKEFSDKYQKLCRKRGQNAVPYLMETLKTSELAGEAIDFINLKGSLPAMRNHRIDDEDLECISIALTGSPMLRMLDLSYNEIGDKGAEAISKFIKVLELIIKVDAVLEVLILKSNNMGPAGITAISNAMHFNNQINYLDLSDNNFGDGGGISLAKMLQVSKS